jgi:hypothetical protein
VRSLAKKLLKIASRCIAQLSLALVQFHGMLSDFAEVMIEVKCRAKAEASRGDLPARVTGSVSTNSTCAQT